MALLSLLIRLSIMILLERKRGSNNGLGAEYGCRKGIKINGTFKCKSGFIV